MIVNQKNLADCAGYTRHARNREGSIATAPQQPREEQVIARPSLDIFQACFRLHCSNKLTQFFRRV